MKSFIVFALVVAAAVAVPVDQQNVKIVRQEADNIGTGPFAYAAELSDGQSLSAQGVLKNVGTEAEALEIRGQYSYVGPDGITYAVAYIANEGGFQPQGAHIPVAPQ